MKRLVFKMVIITESPFDDPTWLETYIPRALQGRMNDTILLNSFAYMAEEKLKTINKSPKKSKGRVKNGTRTRR